MGAELTTPSMPPRPAWLERAMKLARKARTSDSETVATTTSTCTDRWRVLRRSFTESEPRRPRCTSSRPSNCDPTLFGYWVWVRVGRVLHPLERGALRDALAVHPRHRAAVEVQPPAVAALLVGVEVDAARLAEAGSLSGESRAISGRPRVDLGRSREISRMISSQPRVNLGRSRVDLGRPAVPLRSRRARDRSYTKPPRRVREGSEKGPSRCGDARSSSAACGAGGVSRSRSR